MYSSYMKAYQYSLQPINRPHEWKKSDLDPTLSPPIMKTLGTFKKNRLKAKDEPKKTLRKLRRVGLEITSKVCGEKWHNKQSCLQRSNTTNK
ncbi:hypothetical protein DITRI_Ditri05aG0086100 [Diplodiscus trichospermus]